MGITGVQTGLFSKTYKVSRKRQFLPAMAEFPDWMGEFNESNLEFKFRKELGGHRICFLNLADPGDYKSDQFATIGIEELTELPNPLEIIDILQGSLRWPGVDWTPMGFTTNPDGVGHSQVKGAFVTKTIFDHPDHSDKDPNEFNFVRSLPSDNPHLTERYKNQVLAKLPPSLRKPWVEGSWDLFQGQRFEINPLYHVRKPEPLENFEPFRAYRSIDVGFDNPYACGWYILYTDNRGRKRKLKVAEDVRSGLKTYQQIDRVNEITETLGLTGRIEWSTLDTSAWEEEDDGLSIADKFRQGGIEVIQALKSRAAGWTQLETDLDFKLNKEGVLVQEPTLQFFSTCPLTIQQATDALWDPKKPGDILHPEGFRDDALDETRYHVMSHAEAPSTPPPQTRDQYHETVQRHMDRTARRLGRARR